MLLENGKDRNELVFFSKSSHYKKTEERAEKENKAKRKREGKNRLATMQKKLQHYPTTRDTETDRYDELHRNKRRRRTL